MKTLFLRFERWHSKWTGCRFKRWYEFTFYDLMLAILGLCLIYIGIFGDW